MNNTLRILVAVAIGAAAGAALGILFAPQSGNETRKKIQKQGEKLADAVQSKVVGAKKKINDIKENIQGSINRVESQFNEFKDKATEMV